MTETNVRFDHAIILVKNLKKAVRNFRQLGFHVIEGGKLEGGARNAVIPFADGTYLELFSVGSMAVTLAVWLKRLGKLELMAAGRKPMEQRFITHFARGEGIADIAVLVEELEEQIAAVRSRGLDMEELLTGHRLQPDGRKLTFQWGLPDGDLPFFIKDVTPRAWRVPIDGVKHKNGAAGIEEVVVAVENLEVSRARYAALFHAEAFAGNSPVTEFSLGGTKLTLADGGSGADPDLRQHTARYGTSPFALKLRTSLASEAGSLDRFLTGNARIMLVGN
ncbi:MAG: hypothetical protein K0S39_5344 [Paenibacillus sp.]|nr:hypothetical protein [Paenibacillus sp.]